MKKIDVVETVSKKKNLGGETIRICSEKCGCFLDEDYVGVNLCKHFLCKIKYFEIEGKMVLTIIPGDNCPVAKKNKSTIEIFIEEV